MRLLDKVKTYLGLRGVDCSHSDISEFTQEVVNGNLYLHGCKKLETLTSPLKVKGDLWLIGCDNLMKLPNDLKVDGDLYLEGCTRLTEFPENLEVKGTVCVDDISRFTVLAKRSLTFHDGRTDKDYTTEELKGE